MIISYSQDSNLKKKIYEHFGVSNSKYDIILRNLVMQVGFITREFLTSI